ncbi:MAG: hypothetical protein ACE5IK_01625 [Acidobacteriota bacterium]
MKLVVFLTYILYCFYIGVLLVFLPWTPLWDANGIVARFAPVKAVVLTGSVRGAVSGLGGLLFIMGVIDAWRFIRLGPAPPGHRTPSPPSRHVG